VTDIKGAAADFSQGSTMALNEGMVVTNGKVHSSVVATIARHAPK
jgi:hypothetical protein